MANRLQLRKGTTVQNTAFTGAIGELTYDTDKKQVRVHDGSTVGGKIIDDTATEITAGKAKIATTAIAQVGVNDTDFITAKKLRDALNAEGDAPISACRAWVCFDSTTAGTVIRASNNIQSIVRTSLGRFVVTFIDEMPHSDYIVLTGRRDASSAGSSNLGLVVDEQFGVATQTAKTTKTLNVSCVAPSGYRDSYGMSLGVVC